MHPTTTQNVQKEVPTPLVADAPTAASPRSRVETDFVLRDKFQETHPELLVHSLLSTESVQQLLAD